MNYPTGPYVASGNNYIDNSPFHLQQDTYSVRVDQTFGEHDSLFARVSQYWEPQTSSDGYAGATSFAHDYGSNGVIHEIHTFGPTAVMDAFFGRNLGDADTGNNPLGATTGLGIKFASSGRQSQFPRQLSRFRQPCSHPVWVPPI